MIKNILILMTLLLNSSLTHAVEYFCQNGYRLSERGECISGEYLSCRSSNPASAKIQIELLPDQKMAFVEGKKVSFTTLEYPSLLDLDTREADDLFREFHFDKDTLMEFKVYRAVTLNYKQHLFTYFRLKPTSFHPEFKAIQNLNNHELYKCENVLH